MLLAVEVQAFSRWLFGLFVSPLGVFVLAALDATLFFNFPLGIDAAVVILSARLRDFAWIVPLLATAGSVAGAWLTFWMGTTIGEKGLERYVRKSRLDAIRSRVRRSGAIALALLDLLPPPFPFTLFVLAAGALDVRPSTFFITLAVCRMLRFGLEAVLAVAYGRNILPWLEGEAFDYIVAFVMAAVIALTIVSIVRIVRSSRPKRRHAAA